MRERIFTIIEPAEEGDTVSRVYDVFIMVVAVISVVPMMFKPEDLSEGQFFFLKILDIVTVMILIFDYFMRWITFDLKRKSRGREGGPWSFAGYPFTLSAIVDMLAILPTIVPIASSLKFLRLLRLFKIFRSAKNLRIVGAVFLREGRTLLSVLGVIALFIFITGMFMFLVERDTFETFIDALYWATAALTTIGYGDYHPTSDAGQFINAISAILGIVVLAIPTGIIAAGYVAETQRLRGLGVKSHREIDTDQSVAERMIRLHERITSDHAEKKRQGRTLRNALKNNPRIKRYASVMLGCTLFSSLGTIFQASTGIYGNAVLLGPAIAAFVLEPAAGVIVGFVSTLCGCVAEADVSSVLFLGDSCLTAVVFGVVLDRHKKITVRRVLLAYVLMVFAMFVLQGFEAIFSSWTSESEATPIFIQFMFSLVDPAGNIGAGSFEYTMYYLAFYLLWQSVEFWLIVPAFLGINYAINNQSAKKAVKEDPEEVSKQAAPTEDKQAALAADQPIDSSKDEGEVESRP